MQRKDNEEIIPTKIFLAKECLKLTPFITFFILYFVFVRDDGDVLLTTLLKCAPIVSLGLYICLKGFKFNYEYRYSHYILIGIIISCMGDLLLNIDLFPFGMGAFGLAQIFYIIAFGFIPWKILIGIPLYLLGAGMIAYVFRYLDTVIKIGLPIYGILLITMCWRSIVRATVKKSVLATLAAVGSALFVISDTTICVTMFVTPVAGERLIIMITYYLAQLLISISTLSDVLVP